MKMPSVLTGFGLALFLLFPCSLFAAGKGLAAGQKLYDSRCARCHGLNAKGNLDSAKSLGLDPLKLDLTREVVLKKSRKDLEKLVMGGHGRMPKQEALSLDQVRSILKYLQTLQKAYVMK